MKPLVSVIVRAHNAASFLERALISCESSDRYNLEIIVVNDGSTDTTGQLADTIAATDRRVKVVHQENLGVSGACNTGLRHAAGRYVVILDADDELAPAWLMNAIAHLEQSHTIDGVYGKYYHSHLDQTGVSVCRTTPASLELIDLINVNAIPVNALVLRSSVYQRVGLFDVDLPTHEDWQYWLRAAYLGWRVTQLSSSACIVHGHAANTSRNLQRMSAGRLACLSYVARNCSLTAQQARQFRGRRAREVFFARLERVFARDEEAEQYQGDLQYLLAPLAELPTFYRQSPLFIFVKVYLVCLLLGARLRRLLGLSYPPNLRQRLQPIRRRSPLAS